MSAKIQIVEDKTPQPAGLITCAGGGSVLSTFLQEEPFYSGRDLYLLIPKQPMSKAAKLFCITVIKANKYKFSYGRQANKTLPDIELMLPIDDEGNPDWGFMDSNIESLPYGDRIEFLEKKGIDISFPFCYTHNVNRIVNSFERMF